MIQIKPEIHACTRHCYGRVYSFLIPLYLYTALPDSNSSNSECGRLISIWSFWRLYCSVRFRVVPLVTLQPTTLCVHIPECVVCYVIIFGGRALKPLVPGHSSSNPAERNVRFNPSLGRAILRQYSHVVKLQSVLANSARLFIVIQNHKHESWN